METDEMIGFLLMLGGVAWWAFFEWLRGRPRYRAPGVGTQHLCLMGGLGVVVTIGGGVWWLVGRIF